MTPKRLGLFVLVSTFAFGFSAQALDALSCHEAFTVSAMTVPNESLEYIRQLSGRTDFNDADLAQMSKLSSAFSIKPSALYARALEILRMSDADMALTVNTQEVIRASALSMRSTTEQLKTNLGTLIVMVKPLGAGGRRLTVPNRIHLRLATLSLLTGESPGEVAYRYNDNFKAAMSQPPGSAEDLIFAKSPLDIALSLTIAESTIANPQAAIVLAE